MPSQLSKTWEACPTRTVFAHRLVNGQIRPEDAVFVWDIDDSGPTTHYVNIEVGLLPAGAFVAAGGTADDKIKWEAWCRQWRSRHNPNWAPEITFSAYTPERLFAQWIVLGKILKSQRESIGDLLKRRILGFSIGSVDELVRGWSES